MGKLHWQFYFGFFLIALSGALYSVHFALFKDLHHILIYLVGDIAFVPIEVLLVTLVIHKLIDYKEKKATHEKLNMVIGVFFSEIGMELLKNILALDKNRDQIKEDMIVGKNWDEKKIKIANAKIEKYDSKIVADHSSLEILERLLHSKRDFLIKLLENPALLEHDRFTDLLRAIFHLEDELVIRIDINKISDQEKAHIETDIKRAYKPLVLEWVNYLKYLKNRHPHYFLFAVEVNPFKKMVA